jgi:hypothetical protein
MMFRIRAFLNGLALFLLAITTMIRFAQVNFGWTWLWWAAGIITKPDLRDAFAVFEKREGGCTTYWKGLKGGGRSGVY